MRTQNYAFQQHLNKKQSIKLKFLIIIFMQKIIKLKDFTVLDSMSV